MNEKLTDRQREYVRHIARGLDSRAAARAAGYSESFSKVSAYRLGRTPAVSQAIESIRAEGRTMAIYGLVEAMKEAEDAAAFAKLHKNPMANVKACELRAKLSGLLIERVEVLEVDLKVHWSRPDYGCLMPCKQRSQAAHKAHCLPRTQSGRPPVESLHGIESAAMGMEHDLSRETSEGSS